MTHITDGLPNCYSSGSDGIPSFMVDISRGPTGYEQRIARRGFSLRKFNLAYSLRGIDDIYDILQHFEVCEGPLNTFPLLDRLDWKSCGPSDTPLSSDVLLGTGTGALTTFQLRKSYTRGSTTVYRTILLPISGSVLVEVNGTLKTETTHYTVNYTTGIITFTGGNTPPNGQLVKAGFKFKCKVRYDSNDLSFTYEGYKVQSISTVPVIEVIS